MIYFVSGHRDITKEEFEKYYIMALRTAYYEDDKPEFVVGDYEGVDKMAMDYIAENLMCPLTIYHMLDKPRHTPSVTDRIPICYHGGYKTDEERDSAMTRASDIDIAFVKKDRWDGGTAQNIKRRHSINYSAQ